MKPVSSAFSFHPLDDRLQKLTTMWQLLIFKTHVLLRKGVRFSAGQKRKHLNILKNGVVFNLYFGVITKLGYLKN